MPRDKQKNEPKNSAPKKVEKVRGPSAKQRRHERNIAKAKADRDSAIMYGKPGAHFKASESQAKIDAKAATRRRMASYTPATRAEHSAAGREHRKPRSR